MVGKIYTHFMISVMFLAFYLVHQNHSSENTTTARPHQVDKPRTPSLVCNEKLSCRNRCNETTEGNDLSSDPAHCHCDIACTKYHDCCADFVQFCQTNNSVNQGNESIAYTCFKLSTEPGQTHGVFMISTCAKGWIDEDVRAQCLAGSSHGENRTFTSANILEDIPVSILSFDHLPPSYRNIYCGFCNGESDILLTFWTLKFRCNIQPPSDHNATQVLDFLLKYCPNRIVKPGQGFGVRTCVQTVSTCLISNQSNIKSKCLGGPSGVIYSKETKENFKNYYCLLCNGLSTNDVKCGPRIKDNIFNPKSFEIVLEFNPDSKQVTKPTVTPTCATGQVYDPHLETCEPGIYTPLPPSRAIRDKYRIKLWMYPVDSFMELISPNQFRNALCASFSLDPSQIDEISIGIEDLSLAVTFNLYAGGAAPSPSQDKVAQEETLEITLLLSFNNSFKLTIQDKRWDVLRVTQRQLTCAQSEEFLPGDFIPPTDPKSFAIVRKTGQQVPPNRYFLLKDSKTGNESLFVCSSKFLVMCPFLLLPVRSSDYKLFSNKSLQHIATGRLYTTGDYELNDQTALICTNYTTENNSTILVPHANITVFGQSDRLFLWYFTVVGFSMSIVALILTLIVHFIVSDLRSPLPGKNLMSLCMALFLAQFMWLLGSGDTDQPIFCTVVAAVLHYLFLVSFACTAVIAYDTRRTFSVQMSKAPGRSNGKGNLRFLTYTCIAWGLPMIYVGSCFLLDNFQVVGIGYGDEEACWLTKGNAKIVVFLTPIACALLYNVAAFSQTIWAINTARKQTNRVKAKSTRRDSGAVVKVYVRLLTLMGFTWFFAFTAELIHKTMIYPFVVLTSLQGVYIFVAFVCKTRVLKLLRDAFQMSKRDVLASTQNSASTLSKGFHPNHSRSETEETHM